MATAQPPESGEATALPEEYLSLPLRALRMSARRKFAKFLDLEGTLIVAMHNGLEIDIENGFSGMAELAGFDYHDIMNFKVPYQKALWLLDCPLQWIAEWWHHRWPPVSSHFDPCSEESCPIRYENTTPKYLSLAL
ncbi:hypothetical protein DPMN_056278 [Dreissena polymorpha]|uniref:Uncharacterized protein n=1 Tax=Dreissena polymorpha TaxID=45954 RepID=A0A9D4CU72_DREPO|nr:hypothetical protein DPMN_056278 [Dreissena polymorpha]